MSKQVDERVVSMQFDNRNFEKNVKTTIGTLDKLKDKLQLKGATKGLADVDAASKKVNMSTLSDSVEKVGLKFDALYSVADQALRNITNSAVNAGKRIVSALAIDPIKTGFQEYETQINSVQTILANTESKGSTLQDVNSALAELNTYADKTIYNFTEMTRNIGTFTAAGVDLKTSVSAIKGIANLAAVSGSTSQQASTAMYQLSQALSSGTVKLMDWNSVVNAGMGGQVFQDALKETARVHKVNIDAMIKKNGSFRETLQEGWLTSEILTETLSKFTGDLSESQLKAMGYTEEQIKGIVKMGKTANDAATKVKTFTQLFDTLKEASQSGWTKSWELLIGDFGEAKELLTDISNLVGGVIGDSADKRNEMLMGGLSTGWKQLLNEGIHDAAGFEEMMSNVAKEHGVDIASMVDDEHSFQDVLKQTLKDGTLTSDVLGESISKFTEKVGKMSAKELEAAGYTAEQIEKLKELDKNVKNGSVSMEEFSKLIVRPSGRELLIESLWNSIKALQSVLTPLKQAFEEVFPAMTGEQLYKLIEGIRDFTAKLIINEEQAQKLKSTFKGVFSVIKVGVNLVKSVVSGCVKLLGAILPIGQGLLDVGGSLGDFLTGMGEAANKTLSIGSIFDALATILHTVSTGIGKALSALAGGIDKCGGFIGIIQKIAEAFGSLFDKITVAMPGDSIFDTLFNFVNGGIFTAIGVWLAKTIKSLSNFTENAGGFLEGITGILEGVGDALNAFTGSIKAGTLQKIAISIGILAASLFVLSTIDPGRLTTALIGMGVLFKMLMSSLTSLGGILEGNKFKGVTKVTMAMTGIAVSILILSAALKVMSTITWQEMLVGLGGMIIGLQALVRSVKSLPEKDVNGAAKALRKLAVSVLIFAVALKVMGSMSWKEMGVGLISMVVGLGALVGTLHLMPKDMTAKASSLIALASAMVVLSVALKIMGSMSWQEMGVGLISMGVGLGILVGALHLLPKDAAGKAGSVMLLASAMVVLGAAMKIFSSIHWQEMIVGFAGMAASLGLLVGALWLLPKDAAGKAATILILASAMVVLGVAMKVLGSLSWDSIVKGLVSIAGVLVILGVAGYVLAPVAGVLLAIGGAVALLGIGCLAAGAGLVLLATGLTALAAAIVGSVGIILAGANELIGVFTTIILSLVTAMVICIPEITNGLLLLLVSVLSGLVQYTPQLVNLLFDFVIGLIDGIAARLPDLIQAGVNLLMSLFQGIVDALGTIDTSVLIQGLAAVGLFAGLIVALSAIAPFIPGAMLAVLGMGALVVELGLVLAAIGALAQIPGLEWLISEGGDFLQTIGTAIGQFLGGIIGGFAKGMSSALPQIGADLSAFMVNATPFIVGAKMIDSAMLESVKSLAEIILLLTGASILEGLTSWITGGTSFADFGKQLAEFGPYIAEFAESVSGINSEAVTAAANAGKMLAEMADTVPSDWGNNNLTNFGKQFAEFGEDIVAFSKAVTGNISVDGITNAANASKSMVELADSIPNDVGHNNLTNFGTQLENFGSSINTFSDSVNGKAEGIASSTTAIKELIDYVSSITTNEASTISTFSVALTNVGQNGVKGFVEAFANSKEKAQQTVVAFMTAVSNKMETVKVTVYENFKSTGSYLVDGFVKGINENTFKAKAEAAAMAKAAEKAANDELQVNSPSKKFMKVGGSVVEGLAKGIKTNIGDAADSAKNLGSSMLKATQKELQINSPSIVFSKEVGRYIVQGIAEGIKGDMSAEEAAEKKAQNIVNAFKKALDRYDLDSSKASKELELWNLGEGKYATDSEIDTKELDYYNSDLSRKLSKQTLAYDEWKETAKYLGEDSDKAKEAWNKYLDAQLEVAKIQETISGINERIAQRDNDERAKAMDIREKLRENWLKGAGKYATDAEIDARYIADYKADLKNLEADYAEALQEHEELVSKYPASHAKIEEAWNKVIDLENRINDKKADISAIEDNALERESENLNDRIAARNKEHELWEKTDGKYLKDQEKSARKIQILRDNLNDRQSDILIAERQYREIVEEYGAESEEAEAAWNKVLDAKLAVADTQQEIADVTEEAAEKERESLETQYDLASSNADLLYQIWEKTSGRKATSIEKNAAKLTMLTQQLQLQSSTLQLAYEEWQEAASKYGSYSNEAQQAYNKYLREQLELANLQNEITDINEQTVERQKVAQSEYNDYIKRYENYYLKNGMSRSELEKDARLVSGYDPNSTVNTMIDSTGKALSDVQDSQKYSNLLNSFSSFGGSYVTAVNEGIQSANVNLEDSTLTIVNTCIESVKNTYDSWVEAGKYLMVGLANGMYANQSSVILAARSIAATALLAAKQVLGIKSPSREFAEIGMYAMSGFAQGLTDNAQMITGATSTVGEQAIDNLRNSIQRISEVVDSDMDTQPTIRPVLDLSDVESGTARLNSMFSREQALSIGNSMSRNTDKEIQNGVNTSNNGGNTYQFTQNNYSPKALSRIDIYRQTKNQFTAWKGAQT